MLLACSLELSCGSYLKDFTLWEGFLYFLYSACAPWPLVLGLPWHVGFSEEGCPFFSLSCETQVPPVLKKQPAVPWERGALYPYLGSSFPGTAQHSAVLPLLSNIDLLLRNCTADRSLSELWSPGFVRIPHRALSLPGLWV